MPDNLFKPPVWEKYLDTSRVPNPVDVTNPEHAAIVREVVKEAKQKAAELEGWKDEDK